MVTGAGILLKAGGIALKTGGMVLASSGNSCSCCGCPASVSISNFTIQFTYSNDCFSGFGNRCGCVSNPLTPCVTETISIGLLTQSPSCTYFGGVTCVGSGPTNVYVGTGPASLCSSTQRAVVWTGTRWECEMIHSMFVGFSLVYAEYVTYYGPSTASDPRGTWTKTGSVTACGPDSACAPTGSPWPTNITLT